MAWVGVGSISTEEQITGDELTRYRNHRYFSVRKSWQHFIIRIDISYFLHDRFGDRMIEGTYDFLYKVD